MMAEADEPVSVDGLRPGPPVRGRYASAAIRLLAVLMAATCALFASNNWCLVLFPAALAAFLIDYVVCAIRPSFVLRVAVAAVIGVVVGMLLSVGPGWAFEEAFGAEPPAGIREVSIWRHYLGGPGEHALIIEFTADEAALRALTSLRPAKSDSDRVERWRSAGAGWPEAFDVFAGPGPTSFARTSWLRIRPLGDPEVFDFGGVDELRGHLVLFHESRTGRCVALHVRF